MEPFKTSSASLEFLIRVGVIGVLVFLCVEIAAPFLEIILWSIILAVAVYPLFQRVAARFGGRQGTTAIVFAVVLLVLMAIPAFLLGDSLISGMQHLARGLRDGTLHIPPPSERVTGLPIIGEKLGTLWQLASDNLAGFLEAEAVPLKTLATKLVAMVAGALRAVLQFTLAAGVSLYMLSRAEHGSSFVLSVATRLVGPRGADYVALSARTVRSVGAGILGVAVLQAFLAGLALLLGGIPGAGFLTLIILVLCVIQLGPGLVLIPSALYLFSTGATVTAVLFLVWFGILQVMEHILKPLLLGRGVKAPMAVIFVGALGGFLRSGIIGLFTGAVVLVLGYTLFRAWLDSRADLPAEAPPATPPATP